MTITPLTRRRFLGRSALIGATAMALGWKSAGSGRTVPSVKTAAHYICTTCGTQFALSQGAPRECPICLDERQYVGADGQQWTTLDAMRRDDWRNRLREQEPNLVGIGTEPRFGIGQRALVVRTGAGNVLWDCISFLDDATIAAVKSLGGIAAIAISHPHYYSAMVEWSRAFGNVPIYLHEADRRWVQRPDPRIQFWSGETKTVAGDLTLIRTGGHFDGFQVLHWPAGAGGRGVLLSGDQPQVAADRNWVSFMYSYPNFVPLNAAAIRRVVTALDPFPYERLYGYSWSSIVERHARDVVRRSADRYLNAIAG
jgi:hypothetical protein